jgi:hypothetical protein
MRFMIENVRGVRARVREYSWVVWLGVGLSAATACEPGPGPGGERAPDVSGRAAQAQVLPDGGIVPDAGLSPDGGVSPNPADGGASAPLADAAPPVPPGDCCSTSASSGGCSDPEVLSCVCEIDPLCCSTIYDSFCASVAVSRCGQQCDERVPVSDCCQERDVPGCTDPAVEACVCQVDPFCCIFLYDQSCVDIGTSSCGAVCGSP